MLPEKQKQTYGAVQSIVMAVVSGKVRAQFREARIAAKKQGREGK